MKEQRIPLLKKLIWAARVEAYEYEKVEFLYKTRNYLLVPNILCGSFIILLSNTRKYEFMSYFAYADVIVFALGCATLLISYFAYKNNRLLIILTVIPATTISIYMMSLGYNTVLTACFAIFIHSYLAFKCYWVAHYIAQRGTGKDPSVFA